MNRMIRIAWGLFVVSLAAAGCGSAEDETDDDVEVRPVQTETHPQKGMQVGSVYNPCPSWQPNFYCAWTGDCYCY